jgi:predicted RNA-binding protein
MVLDGQVKEEASCDGEMVAERVIYVSVTGDSIKSTYYY